MARKLYAFDIDGTLLTNDKKALESTRESLYKLRQQGHLVTIATGRSRIMAQEVLFDLEFTNYILCNGAAGFLDHEQYYQNLLDQAALTAFLEMTEKQQIGFTCVGLDDLKQMNHYNESEVFEALHSLQQQIPSFDQTFYQSNDIYQALAFYDQTNPINEQLFPDFKFVRWHPYGVDVLPKTGSKAATLLNLAERVGIAHEDIIAFGDGDNDIEMLKEAGIGVAMGNATKYAKQAANFITATNEEDGIFKALKKLGAF
ncbi:putative bifunctional phosphatase/peptidyl-prolyl cis-trans isomerase [Melissococcus plutonius]|uniref:Hydrolase (HAD superfamily) n=1 Tax=Melissococcus plutonius (strain ATCC 35311 / DSM 29964 / CIP 104052 / LMG 20360 / NCIMB 702443) TaxID=940190 RepID=F3Y8H4_MELPT|nr:Cof-type HAD-IIB family hydrolase [Melissococcus plutonius]AIM24511.1 putative bifunctional phosphatase/peptidyl-prolyl cis-trans isomerase [Melissococcus plutonius S1]KMT24560.1 putative bifunctional phosphatase/peptidyl-prolyl cis-trans isomerase [Melissococcus plutonius]KMT29220.1 putative bifunctional phosphatase/peptidyl-prolyl cis-trans isomerase [Melissococcus plutonius]KMT30774.1 putative bifunctional phosphatase/peptidyl-prolyl cis-trans isomerase [Melissococcus plutonius]KMT31262.